jgi:hypothetical protein
MKAKHVKTPETTEEVSSHGVEKRAERHKCQRRAPFAREKLKADWENGLQICGAGRKSRRRPTLVMGKKPNGKSRLKGHAQALVKGSFHVVMAALLSFTATLPAKAQLINGSFIKGCDLAWENGDYNTWLGIDPTEPSWGVGYNSVDLNSYMANMHSMGITVLRVWVNEGDMGDEIDDNDYVTGVTATWTANFANMVQLAANNGIQLYVTLNNGRADWLENPAQAASYLTNALIPLINTYKGNTNIFAIDLMNEIDGVVQGSEGNYTTNGATWAQAQAYISTFAAAIHSADPSRLVSCSTGWHRWGNLSYFLGLGLDFYDFHYYNDTPSFPLASSLGMDKPIYIGECGQATDEWSDSIQSTCELDALNSAYSAGYAGVGIWDYEYPGSDDIHAMVNTNGSWRSVCYTIQNWHSASSNAQIVVPVYDLRTNVNGTPIPPVPGPLDITNFNSAACTDQPADLNYYDDTGVSGGHYTDPPGQTFTAWPSNTLLTSVAIEMADHYGTPAGQWIGGTGPARLYLTLWSVSGATAIPIAIYSSSNNFTFNAGSVQYAAGDWLLFTNLSVPLTANGTYAYTLDAGNGPAGTGNPNNDWCELYAGTGNTYAGGQICLIEWDNTTSNGTVNYGNSSVYDGNFDLGIAPLPPIVLQCSSLTNGQFNFSFQGLNGLNYVLETSTNLASWTPILTDTPSNGIVSFVNTNANDPQRYYRARN